MLHARDGAEEGLANGGIELVRREGKLGGDLEQGSKLMCSGFETRMTGATVGGGASIPTILDGKRSARFSFNGFCRFDFARGGADDHIGEEVAALHWGLGIEKLDALEGGSANSEVCGCRGLGRSPVGWLGLQSGGSALGCHHRRGRCGALDGGRAWLPTGVKVEVKKR